MGPLVLIGISAFFWRVQPRKQRTNRFQVYDVTFQPYMIWDQNLHFRIHCVESRWLAHSQVRWRIVFGAMTNQDIHGSGVSTHRSFPGGTVDG